jgi:dienelactone hydrolase
MSGEIISYEIEGEKFEGYYTAPSDNTPLVFIAHAWGGVSDYEMKRADMLVEMGYAAFAVDLFGAGIRPTEMEERKATIAPLYQDRERMRKLLYGGLDAAKASGGNTDNAVAMGYCFGGACVLELARSGAELKGFVTFHGGLATPEGQDYSGTKGQLLIMHGTADAAISMTDFAKLAEELEAAKVFHEMITYSGAPHAFTVFGSDAYRKDADEKSWRRFGEFLQDTLEQ